MRKIIGMIRPFEMNQTLMVYEDGNKIDLCDTTIETLNVDMLSLMDKHETYQADLVGPKKFLMGLRSAINEEAITRYEVAPEIEINII